MYSTKPAVTRNVLASLRALGVIIAIDDFGTGYSGLSYLGSMHINLLKIDRSFVAMIAEDESTTDLVDVVIDLANRFRMHVIAESVETEWQKNYLLNKRVVYQQDYLFAEPLPLQAFLSCLVSPAVSLAQRRCCRFTTTGEYRRETKKRPAARLNSHCQ
ncbi:EAL domain-containing protein [Candidatus Sodalis pierantonius]|uniref:EAL domain-containing protein n=1 Tax=Candidatus Sodalis pierantonii TaxID=1486991 RepID=UPI0009DD1A3A|nr:EAL domain-containing protein [Candidatus Sodalis pierantonius]